MTTALLFKKGKAYEKSICQAWTRTYFYRHFSYEQTTAFFKAFKNNYFASDNHANHYPIFIQSEKATLLSFTYKTDTHCNTKEGDMLELISHIWMIVQEEGKNKGLNHIVTSILLTSLPSHNPHTSCKQNTQLFNWRQTCWLTSCHSPHISLLRKNIKYLLETAHGWAKIIS